MNVFLLFDDKIIKFCSVWSEEEMNSLKVQVKLAVEKAAKNKSYRS